MVCGWDVWMRDEDGATPFLHASLSLFPFFAKAEDEGREEHYEDEASG